MFINNYMYYLILVHALSHAHGQTKYSQSLVILGKISPNLVQKLSYNTQSQMVTKCLNCQNSY